MNNLSPENELKISEREILISIEDFLSEFFPEQTGWRDWELYRGEELIGDSDGSNTSMYIRTKLVDGERLTFKHKYAINTNKSVDFVIGKKRNGLVSFGDTYIHWDLFSLVANKDETPLAKRKRVERLSCRRNIMPIIVRIDDTRIFPEELIGSYNRCFNSFSEIGFIEKLTVLEIKRLKSIGTLKKENYTLTLLKPNPRNRFMKLYNILKAEKSFSNRYIDIYNDGDSYEVIWGTAARHRRFSNFSRLISFIKDNSLMMNSLKDLFEEQKAPDNPQISNLISDFQKEKLDIDKKLRGEVE